MSAKIFLFTVPHIAAPNPKNKKVMKKLISSAVVAPISMGVGRIKKNNIKKGMPLATEKFAMVGGP